MRFLLDTHTFLWFISGDDQLSGTARDLIGSAENEVLISVASLWEIVIKTGLGKLRLKAPFDEVIPPHLASNDIGVLDIELTHLGALSRLPLHHRDPFDRLIVAQAIAEEVAIVGRDDAFKEYPVRLLW